MNFHLFCDESGRLGCSDREEKYAGEISVLAGVLITSENLNHFSDYVSSVVSKYEKNNLDLDKFHITDLPTILMDKLREDLFGFILEHNIPVAYGAIYYKALAREFSNQKAINKISNDSLKDVGISISKNQSQFKKLSQAECFYYFYTKVICSIIEIFECPVNVSVITDEVDNKTLENYQKQIDRLHFQSDLEPLYGSRFIKKTNKIEKFKVSTSIQLHHKAPRDRWLEQSCGSITKQKVLHSIAADVIANSVLHYLNKYAQNSGFGPLNCYDAIKDHPLASQFIGVQSTIMDKIYPYNVV